MAKTREKHRELIIRIDKMNLSAAKKFELNMMANCAKYIEDVMLKDGQVPDLTYVSKHLDKIERQLK